MKEIDLQYICAIREGGKFYFSAANMNGLFELNLENYSVKFITSFYGYPITYNYLHRSIVSYKNKLYFFPLNGKNIHCYELESGIQRIIEIPTGKTTQITERFHGSYTFVRENRVWLFSRELNIGVFVFDMEKESIRKLEKISKIFSEYDKITNFTENEEGKLFTYSIGHKVLLEIDIERETIKEHFVENCDLDIISINYFKGKFWFVDKYSGDVCEWMIEKDTIYKYVVNGLEWINGKEMPLGMCCFINDKIYTIPLHSKYIMKIDQQSGKIVKAIGYPKDFYFFTELEIGAFSLYEVIGDLIWFHPCKGNRLLIYNTKSEQIESKKIFTNFYTILDYVFFQEEVINESAICSLDYWCQSNLKKYRNNDGVKVSIGRVIYEKMMI